LNLLVLGNNWVAWKIVEWLRSSGENIVGLVLHPEPKRKYGDEIVKTADVSPASILDGSRLKEPETLERIQQLKPDLALSLFFDYVLKPELIDIFERGVVNVHPAYLPYNRGQYPNVWSIVEGTPAGVTIHFINDQIDTGDVISQASVEVEPIDTGATLYRKLELACLKLFTETWPTLRAGKAAREAQKPGMGTYHRTRDVDHIDEIDLDRSYRARELIDILRARTFAPYPGAYFRDGDRRIFMRLQLDYEEDIQN
jgi:methionyl-tRNA formyltransferase